MSQRFLGVIAVLGCLAAGEVAAAEDAQPIPRPGYENRRFDEDWSFLDETESDHFLDPIKYIPIDEAGVVWLSFGGQLRGRSEFWNDFLFGASIPEEDDAYALLRVRLHGQVHVTKYARIFAEFQGSYSTDRELQGQKRFVDKDIARLQNGFVELVLPIDDLGQTSSGTTLAFRGGRQELQFGAQRLVSPLIWANVRNTFDGALLHVDAPGIEASGFWSRPVQTAQNGFDKSTSQLEFFGIYGSAELPRRLGPLRLDLYWLGLERDSGLPDTPTGKGTRHTLGGRIHGELGSTGLFLDLEGAAQIGSQSGGTISAGMVSLLLSYPFASVTTEPELYAGADWASGSRTGTRSTFNQLFPLGHAYFGYIDVVGRQNIRTVHGGLSFSPIRKARVALTWHGFWLDEPGDALYAPSGAPIRRDPTANERFVGAEMDLSASYEIITGLFALAGYSHFFSGAYLAESGPDKDVDFGYLQLQYDF